MSEPDIDIRVGDGFTTARVDGRIVAVLWGRGREHFVTDGRGAPIHCASREEATRHMMRIAMDGNGVATVAHTPETDDDIGPLDEMVQAAQAATCRAESDDCMTAAIKAAFAVRRAGLSRRTS